jgi:hypothetical protein
VENPRLRRQLRLRAVIVIVAAQANLRIAASTPALSVAPTGTMFAAGNVSLTLVACL